MQVDVWRALGVGLVASTVMVFFSLWVSPSFGIWAYWIFNATIAIVVTAGFAQVYFKANPTQASIRTGIYFGAVVIAAQFLAGLLGSLSGFVPPSLESTPDMMIGGLIMIGLTIAASAFTGWFLQRNQVRKQ